MRIGNSLPTLTPQTDKPKSWLKQTVENGLDDFRTADRYSFQNVTGRALRGAVYGLVAGELSGGNSAAVGGALTSALQLPNKEIAQGEGELALRFGVPVAVKTAAMVGIGAALGGGPLA